jgi:lipopolysaccharide biosynthesis glycosyltransferase
MQQLDLRFVVFGNEEFMHEWEYVMSKIFPTVAQQSKLWKKRESSQYLRNVGFETDVIYARMYLPEIFPDLTRFIYLDNDIVVTSSLVELMLYSLQIKSFESIVQKSNQVSAMAQQSAISHLRHSMSPASMKHTDLRTHTHDHIHKYHQQRDIGHHRHLAAKEYAAIGLVYETHPFYKGYMKSNFNLSAPIVRDALKALGRDDLFLNGGVIVYDAVLWRQRKYRERAEQLMKMNTNGSLYSSSVGDQGVFYLMLQEKVAFLPAKFNMRRLPKHTTNLLEDGVSGIVHFAGTTGGNAEVLCKDPMQYPLLANAAMPLYLSIIHSYNNTAQKRVLGSSGDLQDNMNDTKVNGDIDSISWQWRYGSVCADAVDFLKRGLKKDKITVKFNPGAGQFTWPPF